MGARNERMADELSRVCAGHWAGSQFGETPAGLLGWQMRWSMKRLKFNLICTIYSCIFYKKIGTDVGAHTYGTIQGSFV